MAFKKLAEHLKRAQERSATRVNFWRFPKGKSLVRILPAAEGDDPENFFVYVGMHFNVNPSNFPVICRRLTDYRDEECPICDLSDSLAKEGKTAEAKDIAASSRYVLRVLVRGEEEKGAQLVLCPVSVFTSIGEIIQDSGVFGDVLSLRDGRDIQVIRQGDGMATRYQVQAMPAQTRVMNKKEAADRLMASLEPLSKIIQIPSLDEVRRYISVAEDADETPRGYSPAGTGDYSSTPEDDSWESDSSEDDEDDDEKDDDDVILDEDGDDSWGPASTADDDEDDDAPLMSAAEALSKVRGSVADAVKGSKKTVKK